MSKKLAMLGIVAVLCIVGLAFVGGCDKKSTAAVQEDKVVCQKETQAVCSRTLTSSQKKACGLKTEACPTDCKMECCLAKQKAGACPLQGDKTSLPKACQEKAEAL